ncbi:MAG: hypothetical protein JHC95_16890 [Solirubrobacteraceae bacterium]|nr:hypothetical protein [Solirubrobacteraceae bacterium]
MSGVARAETPYEALSNAKAGASVKLAQGLTLTPEAIQREGSTIRISRARLKVGGVATGYGVRAVATPDSIRILGGRFGVADNLTDRDYTIAGDSPLTVATAADGSPAITGRFASLPPRKGAKVRAAGDVSEPEVEQALPAAPGGQRWRIGLGLNGSGVVVRAFLGDAQVGSGLVRYDGSYRVSLGLTDYPVMGAKVSVAGDVAGSSILNPAPIADLKGTVDGQMKVTDDLSVGDGSLAWDAGGLHVDAQAKLACPQGGLGAGATGTYKTDGDWDFKVKGATDTDGCGLAKNAVISSQDISGEVVAKDGDVTGGVTAAGAESEVTVSDAFALQQPTVQWTPRGVRIGAGLKTPCPQGGEITIGFNVLLPGTGLRLSDDWEFKLSTRTGPNGCGLVQGLKFGGNNTVNLTVGTYRGEFGMDLDMDAEIKTQLIPTKEGFGIKLKLHILGSSEFSMSVAGKAPGAEFKLVVNPDTTFEADFNITDLQIGATKLVVIGTMKQIRPHGPIDTDLKTDVSGTTKLTDNLALLGFSLGINRDGSLAFAGTFRVKCTRGYFDLSASGDFRTGNSFDFTVESLSTDCHFGHLITFDGQSIIGHISGVKGQIGVDLTARINETNLPDTVNPRWGTLAMRLYGTSAHITNQCSDGCSQEKLRIELDGRTSIGLKLPFDEHKLLLDARLVAKIDVASNVATRFYLGLIDIYIDGVPSPLVVELEGELIRALGKGFTTKPPPAVPPVDEPADFNATSVTGRSRLGDVRGLKVGLGGGRATATVTLSRRASVTLELEHRSCSGSSCRWQLIAFKVAKANTKRVATFRAPTKLSKGSYRFVARMGAAGSGTPVVKRFKVG